MATRDRAAASVVVTTYNHADFVEQALDSLLAQDFPDVEVVITDDCSTDGTPDVVRRWLARTGMPATLVVQPRNIGLCASLNRALARMAGDVVCVLSGDDLLEPDRLSRQVAALRAQPDDVALVYGDVRIIDAEGRTLAESYLDQTRFGPSRLWPPSGRVFAEVQHSCFLPAAGVLLRRSAIDAVGGYDEGLEFEDWDMWLRLADRFRLVHQPGPVVASWRVLPTSMYHSLYATPDYQASVARLQSKWLDRDPASRRVAARWIRDAAANLAPTDPAEARRLLASTRGTPAAGRVPWRAFEAALAVPGAHRTVRPLRRAWTRGAAAVAAERGAWASGRRLRRRRRTRITRGR